MPFMGADGRAPRRAGLVLPFSASISTHHDYFRVPVRSYIYSPCGPVLIYCIAYFACTCDMCMCMCMLVSKTIFHYTLDITHVLSTQLSFGLFRYGE